MSGNVGNIIQKLLNNTPIAVALNDTSTAVATNGGNVFHTGLIGGRIQFSFREILINDNIIGRIIEVKATKDKLYFLSSCGSVFEYDYCTDENPIINEVYSPTTYNGDKACKIVAGRAHLLILTESGKVLGVGSNSEYQLVPQGKSKYDTAVEIIITDTNLHDNNSTTSFTGVFNELECPIVPPCEPNCNRIACIKDKKCDAHLGYLNVCRITITPPGVCGILSIPIYGDYNYVGFLCIDDKKCATGTVTYNVTKLYIKCGCLVGKFTYKDYNECISRDVDLSITKDILIFEGDSSAEANTDLCAHTSGTFPITGTTQVNGKCNTCVIVNVELPCGLPIPYAELDSSSSTLILTLKQCKSNVNLVCDGTFNELHMDENCRTKTDLVSDFDVLLNCDVSKCDKGCGSKKDSCCCGTHFTHETSCGDKCNFKCNARYITPCASLKKCIPIPQPCWINIHAGGDISVLVDNCNRIYVLGSLHKVRSNKNLTKRTCLEELLNKTNASVSFPADQLNCSNLTSKDCGSCKCNKCKKTFKTDLNKFGIHLSFPQSADGHGHDKCNDDDKITNVCDFLQSLKKCNEQDICESICESCDTYIYLNVSGDCGIPCGTPSSPPIGSITVFNSKSISKLVNQGRPDINRISIDTSSIIEFDLNEYSVDNINVPLEQILKLDFPCDGPNVNLYIDVTQPGGIKFIADVKKCSVEKCNVDFTINASNQKTHQFILNFGPVLDPVELANLKNALSLDSFFNNPLFKNPPDTKIINTYIKGGDRVKFVVANPKNIRQAITADIPTVFRLNRRIIDVGVGFNNLSVIVGGLSCPNELLALGNNCYGELGIGSNETVVTWKNVSRRAFDGQVIRVHSGKYVTFYITQCHQVYASGQWKWFVDSNTPQLIKTICQSWKICHIAIGRNQIVFLGTEGHLLGIGNNSLGELGLFHLEKVFRPTTLPLSSRLHGNIAKQLRDNIDHPIEVKRNTRANAPVSCPNGSCGNTSCGSDKTGNCGCNNCTGGNFGGSPFNNFNNDPGKNSKFSRPGPSNGFKRYHPNSRLGNFRPK